MESYRKLHTSSLVYDISHSSSTSGIFRESLIEVVRLDDIGDIFLARRRCAKCIYGIW